MSGKLIFKVFVNIIMEIDRNCCMILNLLKILLTLTTRLYNHDLRHILKVCNNIEQILISFFLYFILLMI